MNQSITYYILFCANITFFAYGAQPTPPQNSDSSVHTFYKIDPVLLDFIEGTQVKSVSSQGHRESLIPPTKDERRMSLSVGGTEHLSLERVAAFHHHRSDTQLPLETSSPSKLDNKLTNN